MEERKEDMAPSIDYYIERSGQKMYRFDGKHIDHIPKSLMRKVRWRVIWEVFQWKGWKRREEEKKKIEMNTIRIGNSEKFVGVKKWREEEKAKSWITSKTWNGWQVKHIASFFFSFYFLLFIPLRCQSNHLAILPYTFSFTTTWPLLNSCQAH